MKRRNGTPARVKQLRAKTGLTQRDFAAKLRVNYMTVSRWERGETTPRGKELKKLCTVGGVTPHWLLTGAISEPPGPPDAPIRGEARRMEQMALAYEDEGRPSEHLWNAAASLWEEAGDVQRAERARGISASKKKRQG